MQEVGPATAAAELRAGMAIELEGVRSRLAAAGTGRVNVKTGRTVERVKENRG